MFVTDYVILLVEQRERLYLVTGLLRIRQAWFELGLRSAGDGCIITSTVKLTANNNSNTYALAA